jgi:simple sugar transport system permease protein
VLGLKYRLFHLFSPGYGYDGIVVAFLAGANPLFVIVSSLFLAGLRSGANIMQRVVGVQTTVVEAVQGLVIIFVAISLAFHFDRRGWGGLLRFRKEVPVAYQHPEEAMNHGRDLPQSKDVD